MKKRVILCATPEYLKLVMSLKRKPSEKMIAAVLEYLDGDYWQRMWGGLARVAEKHQLSQSELSRELDKVVRYNEVFDQARNFPKLVVIQEQCNNV